MTRSALVRRLPAAALLLAAALAPAAEPAADAARRLAGRALGPTPLMSDLRELCDRVGGRPTGSPACSRAVAWAAEKLRAAGLTSVRMERFVVPGLWLPGTAEGEIVTPERFPVRLVAAPFSPSTPGEQALEARVVDVGEGTKEDLARAGGRARGAILLVRSKEMKTIDDLFGEYLRNAPLLQAAKDAGAAGLLLQSTRPRGLLYRHPVTFDGSLGPVPAATVSREDGARVARLLEAGEVTLRMRLANKTGAPYEAENVVAEIPGRERPEEVVLLGAHLDSWELGTGANDNGVNASLVLDVARGMKELGIAPRRTVRFVLFTGEEQGMWGSAGYAKAHAKELPKHAAVVIYDIGSGRTSGFFLNGREELRKPVERALAAVEGLGGFDHPIDGIDGTDNYDFLLWGVPNLVASQDWVPYLPDYHAESDTYDKVDAREAKANAAIASALVWGLAESPERLSQQSRAQVEELLSRTKLDEQMRAFGQWADWAAGRRGLPK